MEHVENGRPVLHGKVAQKLRHKEWYHFGHPAACLSQGCSEVGCPQFCLVTWSELPEDVEAERQASHDVPVDVHNRHAERIQCEPQDVDGRKACRGPTMAQDLVGLPRGVITLRKVTSKMPSPKPDSM